MSNSRSRQALIAAVLLFPLSAAAQGFAVQSLPSAQETTYSAGNPPTITAEQAAKTRVSSPVPPQVPMVIEQADADALRDIIDSTIPQRYTPMLIRWFNAIFARQQARQAELAKQAVPIPPAGEK